MCSTSSDWRPRSERRAIADRQADARTADKLDPEAGSLIWESDKGPMGVDVRIWRELSGDLDVWVYVDWEEWHVESVSEAHDMSRQAMRLAQWLDELAALLEQFKGLPQ